MALKNDKSFISKVKFVWCDFLTRRDFLGPLAERTVGLYTVRSQCYTPKQWIPDIPEYNYSDFAVIRRLFLWLVLFSHFRRIFNYCSFVVWRTNLTKVRSFNNLTLVELTDAIDMKLRHNAYTKVTLNFHKVRRPSRKVPSLQLFLGDIKIYPTDTSKFLMWSTRPF